MNLLEGMRMSCAEYQQRFSPYIDGLLSGDERESLEAHVGGCARCQAELASLRTMLSTLQTMEQPPAPDLLPGIHRKLAQQLWWRMVVDRLGAPWRLPWHSLALAGTAAIALVAVGLTMYLQRGIQGGMKSNADSIGQQFSAIESWTSHAKLHTADQDALSPTSQSAASCIHCDAKGLERTSEPLRLASARNGELNGDNLMDRSEFQQEWEQYRDRALSERAANEKVLGRGGVVGGQEADFSTGVVGVGDDSNVVSAGDHAQVMDEGLATKAQGKLENFRQYSEGEKLGARADGPPAAIPPATASPTNEGRVAVASGVFITVPERQEDQFARHSGDRELMKATSPAVVEEFAEYAKLPGPSKESGESSTAPTDGNKHLPPPEELPTPTDQVTCEARQGKWAAVGMRRVYRCNLPTKDADKPCADGSECESHACIADQAVPVGQSVTGRCYGWTITLGTCLNRLMHGQVSGPLCED